MTRSERIRKREQERLSHLPTLEELQEQLEEIKEQIELIKEQDKKEGEQ